jgi:hypothetical protein
MKTRKNASLWVVVQGLFEHRYAKFSQNGTSFATLYEPLQRGGRCAVPGLPLRGLAIDPYGAVLSVVRRAEARQLSGMINGFE